MFQPTSWVLFYRFEAAAFIDKTRLVCRIIFTSEEMTFVGGFSSPYLQTFKLQVVYEFSSTDAYGWLVWTPFEGFINDKIPVLNKLVLQGIELFRPVADQFSYIEPWLRCRRGHWSVSEWICFGAFKTGITKKMASG